MFNNKKPFGFSIIEIIVSISILIIISIVAVTSYSGVQDNSTNSKIISDLETLNNSFKSYYSENNSLPMPKGNLQFYSEDTSYAHSYEDTNTFGVSGYITENTIPKKYINYTPLDPNTNQYYGYGITKKYFAFEIAGVVRKDGKYFSKILGNWGGESGPINLVKEFAGPNFVSENSNTYFPYNPGEKVIYSKIDSFSGVLFLNNKQITESDLGNINLKNGDKINISTGGTANIYNGDGSNLILGDNTSSSEMILANMNYVEENNLFTSVKIILNVGGLWTKASKLGEKSEFEVYTPDTVAAVRGTIFGINKDKDKTSITLIKGKIEVNKLDSGQDLKNKLENNTNITTTTIQNNSSTGNILSEDSKSYIEVKDGEISKSIAVFSGSYNSNTSSTGSIDKIPLEIKSEILEGVTDINENTQINFESFEKNINNTSEGLTGTNSGFYIKIKQSKLLNNKKLFVINQTTNEVKELGNNNYFSSGVLLNLQNGKNIIYICKKDNLDNLKKCSAPKKVNYTEGKTPVTLNIDIDKKYTKVDELGKTENNTNLITLSFSGNTSGEYDINKINSIYTGFYIDILNRKPTKEEFEKYNYGDIKYEEIINYLSRNQSDYKNIILNSDKLDGKITDNYLKFKLGLSYDKILPNEKIENNLKKDGYELFGYAGFNEPSLINNSFLKMETFTGLTISADNGTLSQPASSSKQTGGACIPNYQNNIFVNNSSKDDTAYLGYITKGNISFDRTNHIITDKNNGEKRGLFIDNTGYDSFLKYSLPNYLSGKTAIELNVRGISMFREGIKYNLIGDNTKNIYLEGGEIKCIGCINNNILSTSYNNEKIFIEMKDENNDDTYKMKKDLDYYKIIIILNSNEISIKVLDKAKNILSQNTINNTGNFDLSNLYIGSSKYSNYYINQFNDIIDYVKIYKKID